jgi:hypothetical protein
VCTWKVGLGKLKHIYFLPRFEAAKTDMLGTVIK